MIARTLETEGDSTGIAVIGANKSEADIISKEELQLFKGNWESMEDNPGLKNGVSPEDRRVALLYGPPATTQKAALPARRD